MSYTRQIGNAIITVVCISNPKYTYQEYYKEIECMIVNDGYKPKTSMDNLVVMLVLSFDCDDNYGDYDEESGCGGYGDSFTMEGLRQYIEDSGGYAEFDYWC